MKKDYAALRAALKLVHLNRLQFSWAVLAGAAGLGCSVGLAAVSAWLIAKASQMPPVLDLAVAATSVRALGVGKAVFRYLNRLAAHRVALDGMSALRTRMYETLANSPTDVVTSIRHGDLLARTGADIDTVGDVVVRSLQPAAVAVLVSLLSVGIVSALSPQIGLILFISLLLSGVLAPLLAMRGVRAAEQAQVDDRAELTAHSLTLLESAEELRVSGRLEEVEAALERTERRIFFDRDRAARPSALAAALDVLATALAVVGALVLGSQQVENGTLAPLALAVVVLTPLAAFEATQVMPMAGIQLIRSARSAGRIMALLEKASEHDLHGKSSNTAKANGTAAPEIAAAPTSQPGVYGHETPNVEVSSLIVGWPEGPNVAGPFSFRVRPGEKLAIVGPSGIGKSTLLYSLAGMLHPHAGHVRLEGKEISHLDRAEVSASLTLTAEDAHIFATSILENIRVARGDITPEEAADLLTQAGLGEWLAQLPSGVHTMLGAEAMTISGGERRRLLLARALASPAPILLLDEPGEHLDPSTADRLIRDLLTIDEKRAVVLVTHRLSPLDVADRIMVLGRTSHEPSREADEILSVSQMAPTTQAGLRVETSPVRVIAEGTHAELLTSCPTYAWAYAQEQPMKLTTPQGSHNE